jgi:hypothetical protein
VGFVSGVGGAVAASYYLLHRAETIISNAIDDKIRPTIADLESKGRRFEKENELVRNAITCQHEMMTQSCVGKDPRESYRLFMRQFKIEDIPSAIRNHMYRMVLEETVRNGDFDSLKEDELGSMAKSLESEFKGDASCYKTTLVLGTCYLCLKQPGKARTLLLRALRSRELASPNRADVVPEIYSMILLTAIVEPLTHPRAMRVNTAMQLMDECEVIQPASFFRVNNELKALQSYPFFAYLRLSYLDEVSKPLALLIDEIEKNDDRVRYVRENEKLYLRGTVTVGGKPHEINRTVPTPAPDPTGPVRKPPEKMKKPPEEKESKIPPHVEPRFFDAPGHGGC